jgi:hypothetical protein
MRRLGLIVLLLSGVAAAQTDSGQSGQNQSGQTGNVWNVTIVAGITANSSVTATNECFATHKFQTSFNISFMKLIGPDTFSVAPRQSREFPVQFDTRGMSPGSYDGFVRVRCLDCNHEKGCKQDYTDLHVMLTVPPPKAPPEETPPNLHPEWKPSRTTNLWSGVNISIKPKGAK